MSSHDELNKAISFAFDDLNEKLREAESKAHVSGIELERLYLLLNEIRAILAGDDGPEDKIQSIEELLK